MKKFLAVLVASLFVLTASGATAFGWFGVSSDGTATSYSDGTAGTCSHYSGHIYEVCTAYIANSSLAVLVPYYTYANSTNSTWSRYVTYRLSSRYTSQAHELLTNRVANWPVGYYDVSFPHIQVLMVSSDLNTNTATLQTLESWRVQDANGRITYQEHDQLHDITMHRVQSYLLHKWVVSNIASS